MLREAVRNEKGRRDAVTDLAAEVTVCELTTCEPCGSAGNGQGDAVPGRCAWPQRTAASRDARGAGLGCDAEELVQVLAGDQAPSADLGIGQVAAAHLVVQQVAG
jgi:hypothetical protein